MPLPIQQRAPDHWSINPAFAYAYLGKARDFTGRVRYIDEGGGLCFASHHPQFGITFSGGVAWAIRESIMYMTWRLIGNDNFQVNVTPAWQMDPLFLEPWSDADYALDAAARAAEPWVRGVSGPFRTRGPCSNLTMIWATNFEGLDEPNSERIYSSRLRLRLPSRA
ncbi:MAG: hypothetical protein EB072_17530 [Betaproteobacteria bacterium]|nr:hypothetical protein [Betaproteobacteria bacterium]